MKKVKIASDKKYAQPNDLNFTRKCMGTVSTENN